MPQRRHGTLTPATVATVTVDAPAETGGRTSGVGHRRLTAVEVLNRGSSDPIYFRLDAVDPTVAGDDTYVVPPNSGVEVDAQPADQVEVRLISVGAMAYSITGIE